MGDNRVGGNIDGWDLNNLPSLTSLRMIENQIEEISMDGI